VQVSGLYGRDKLLGARLLMKPFPAIVATSLFHVLLCHHCRCTTAVPRLDSACTGFVHVAPQCRSPHLSQLARASSVAGNAHSARCHERHVPADRYARVCVCVHATGTLTLTAPSDKAQRAAAHRYPPCTSATCTVWRLPASPLVGGGAAACARHGHQQCAQ
jgi:hypothetical protein